MFEKVKRPEAELIIQLIDGVHVDEYLNSGLKEQFVRTLVTANRAGVFDEDYFQSYMYTFERRLQDGKVTLLLVNGEPAAVGAIDIVGPYLDGRTLYELCNLVILPQFRGYGYASQLMEYRFCKIRNYFPNDPFIITTRAAKVAEKCLKLGMKEQPCEVELSIRAPKANFSNADDDWYEAKLSEWAKRMRGDGFKNYCFDPLEK